MTSPEIASHTPLPDHAPLPLRRGLELLHDPRFNKGTAFTTKERNALGLRGLLPPGVFDEQAQLARNIQTLRRKDTDFERYQVLSALAERNQTLFYRLLCQHITELMPIVYTPTVGEACQRYGYYFQRTRGLFISAEDRGHVREALHNWPERDVRVIVVTDGSRILGLGDLGAHGMGIPVGKLTLYTACAGVPPHQCLPITLDVGCDNDALREDPLYVGLRRRRVRGPEYDALLEEFIVAVREVYPRALVQFEDFANDVAFDLLQRYRDQICCFNDDIQGTAAVTVAGVLASLQLTQRRLAEQRLLFVGAGEAGIGIADLFVAMLGEFGVPADVARQQCWFVDRKGLVTAERADLNHHKRRYAHASPGPAADLLSAVELLRPTALIGVSGQPQAIKQPVIEAMARMQERPIVFALSNPTSKAECTAEQAYAWSSGRAVFASGSPFQPCTVDGRRFTPGQGNNAWIFPGVGLGVLATGSRRVTEEMFIAAARTLAREVRQEDLDFGSVYPPLERIRDVSVRIAVAVAEVAFAKGLASVERPRDLSGWVRAHVWEPRYPTYA
ncbi:MAG: NAD-dependent malic enzyme [Planctomycetes bacterium]|nr:NAD-dependent malic enzyme [Planctomycetota bacterium]